MRSGKLVVIHPDGTRVETRHKAPPGLATLQEAVGGYIERVRVRFEGRVRDAFVNEEGALNGLPNNRDATAMLANPTLTVTGYLQGNLAVWVPDPKPVRTGRKEVDDREEATTG